MLWVKGGMCAYQVNVRYLRSTSRFVEGASLVANLRIYIFLVMKDLFYAIKLEYQI